MSTTRARIFVRGAVQGVGFRPFVYRLANELQIGGSVSNSSQGVAIEAEGEWEHVETFINRLRSDKPPRASIRTLDHILVAPLGLMQFEIRESSEAGDKSAQVLPDIATCDDCLREIFDPTNRRYVYPFTNCTNCGPRFTIIESLPYDRANTSMKTFAMCEDCHAEYHDPNNRRFQAQPNACPRCGPHVELFDGHELLEQHHRAIALVAHMIRMGKIVAIKGIGGFHLIVDAANDKAVQTLRRRKHREEKPFALMFPSLDSIHPVCEASETECRLLTAAQAPIVLLKQRNQQTSIASSVAPNNPNLGVMLPYSPLHHILMHELNFPVVATSGNLSDEPICTNEVEARERLRGIADFFLVHNRPIVRHADDSIVCVILDREMLLRAGRGYAPIYIPMPQQGPTILSVGAHLKNTVALKRGDTAIISQHIGDLETKEAHCAFEKIVGDLQKFYEATPSAVACDLHPDYSSTAYAREFDIPTIAVQHHYAHVLSCLAENELGPPALGVAWDGTGLGTDGTIWGGEFLQINVSGFERVAHIGTFRLPGGDAAARKPYRCAIGLIYELFGQDVERCRHLPPFLACSQHELALIRQMIERETNTPVTSSMGRLFDAVASLIGLRHSCSFEGQAAMELEFAARSKTEEAYPFSIRQGTPLIVDWKPMVICIIDDLRRRTSIERVATKFHNTLARMLLTVAERVGEELVVLSGGCFQNKLLLETAVTQLKAHGFHPVFHRRIPTNDGGIALGQTVAALSARLQQTVTNPQPET
jgi:hydrogenase maturation protein HypF